MHHINTHYVPKFFQRAYSINRTGIFRFNLDNPNNGLERRNLERSGARRRLYDRNFEQNLGRIENEQATIIQMINSARTVPTSRADRQLLLQFITIQSRRTLKIYEDLQKKVDVYANKRYSPQLLDLLPSDWSDQVSYAVFKLMIKGSIQVYWVGIADLEIEILKNNTAIDFIYSDHPVALKNLKLNDSNRDTKGLQNTGLMIFVPTNRKTMLVLYDRSHYFLRSSSGTSVIDVNSPKDITQLNILQFYTCYQKIYCANFNYQDYILKLYNTHKKQIELTRKKNTLSSLKEFYVRPDSSFVPNLSFVEKLDSPIKRPHRDKRILNQIMKKGRKFRVDFLKEYPWNIPKPSENGILT